MFAFYKQSSLLFNTSLTRFYIYRTEILFNVASFNKCFLCNNVFNIE